MTMTEDSIAFVLQVQTLYCQSCGFVEPNLLKKKIPAGGEPAVAGSGPFVRFQVALQHEASDT